MTEAEIRAVLTERLKRVEERIQAACARAGRPRESVTLVAVTKTVSTRVAGLLPELGIFDLGENRPQELKRRADQLKNRGIRWHMIGHMQRNKVAETLSRTHLIHSVDSARLFAEIAKESAKTGQSPKVLLQVNGSREAAKQGFSYAELAEFLKAGRAESRVEIAGCMTMAAYFDDPEQCRDTFRELRLFAEKFTVGPQLSMGMSNDFEVAIEEGATLIRLGSVLFEGLPNVEE